MVLICLGCCGDGKQTDPNATTENTDQDDHDSLLGTWTQTHWRGDVDKLKIQEKQRHGHSLNARRGEIFGL